MANILKLDDRDPSIIYSPGWAQGGSANEFDRTTSWTAVAGSNAKLTFTGTSIGVFGTVPERLTLASVAPMSVYSIDGGAPTIFQATETGQTQFSQLFYQSPVLPDGIHVLTITHPTISDPLFLDFLMVTQNTASTPTLNIGGVTTTSTSTGTTTTSSTSTTTTLPTTTVASSTTTSTSTPPTPVTVTVTSIAQSTTASSDADSVPANASGKNNAASTNHTGAIVGGILGAILVLFLIVFGLIIWRRKRRDRRSSMIASNFWNTGTSTPPPPLKSFAPPTSTTASPRMNHNAPLMAQTTGGSAPYNTPRYPGGYAPAAPSNQAVTYGGYAPSPAPYAYPAASERGYYAQGSDQGYHQGYSDPGYSAGTYLPPSQILSANVGNDYSRGGR